MEKEYKGWKYFIEKKPTGTEFNIIPYDATPKPTVLHKLYALNQNSFDSLINGYIYATHPDQFNDLFDCYDELIIFDDIDFIKNFLNKFSDLSKEEIDFRIANNLPEIKTFVQRNFKAGIYRAIGVFSMTGNPNNILMWSYYTNHQGFCVEFDLTKFPFTFYGPFPVNYQDKPEPISIKEVGKDIAILYQTNVKYAEWRHENEWRLLVIAPSGEAMYSPSFDELKKLGGHNRKFNYPIEAIKSIALGNRFFSYKELNPINEKQLEINLKTNFEQKSILLEFLFENNILTHMAQRNKDLYSIGFTPGFVEKINYKKYLLNAVA